MIHVVPLVALLSLLAPLPPQSAGSDLDTLMGDVLERRDANREALAAYEFRETEALEIRGQDEIAPLQSSSKEFLWRRRDGLMVRDPVSVNGVPVGGVGRGWEVGAVSSDRGLSTDDFYDWDSFFNFQFEPGHYYLAGRETFEGREVLRIEYYPRHLFSRAGDESSLGAGLDRTTVVTMLVSVGDRQIVKWTFANVGMQFLPFRWLVRVGAAEVSMILDTGPDGAWLPRRIELGARASVATSQLTIRLTRDFHHFVRATDGTPLPVGGPNAPDAAVAAEVSVGGSFEGSGGTINRVRFHGNHSISDGQLGGIVGVRPGDSLTAELPAQVRRRLLDSGLVDRADVRVRGTSLQDADDIALVILVRERVGFGDHFQFLPMFEWSDEYGITVGGRVSIVEIYGDDERLSFPLSIGGRDRAAVEFSDDFQHRFISRLRTSAGYLREVNPHFEESETRVHAEVLVSKRWGRFGEVDVHAGWADVDFLGTEDQQATFGVSARFDTRRETGLPRNAVYVEGGWQPLKIIDGPYRNRFDLDLRGFVGVLERTTIAIGAQYNGADGPLPSYERYLMGGLTTLRGFEPGTFIGDNRAIASVELRVPVWEPFPIMLVGVNGFWDTGAVWDDGTQVAEAKFHNGVGGGVFLMAAFLQLNVDVAYGLDNGWVVHIGSGLRY